MVSASTISSRCATSTFATPTLFGAEFLSIEANVVSDYSFDVPHGWTYSQPALNVQNVTFCIFYGKAPSYSHWNDCSQGGRQGLKLAQQYPTAYDGIIAAAPAVNWAEFYIDSVWPVFYMESTQQFPRDCELSAITSLAVSACDELDSVKDGIFSNVDACRRKFDPFKQVGKSFDCSSTKSKLKISHAAAAVANASWTGPLFSDGKSMYPGFDIGSDLPTLAPTNCTGKVCKSGAEGSVEFAWRAFVKKDNTSPSSFSTPRMHGLALDAHAPSSDFPATIRV